MGFFGEILHQEWHVNTGNLNSSGKVVEWGETLMQWLSLLLDVGQVPPSLSAMSNPALKKSFVSQECMSPI